jgi:hypothetical protein
MRKVPQHYVDLLETYVDTEFPDVKILFKEDNDWHKASVHCFFVWLFVSVVGIFWKKFKTDFNTRYSNALAGKILIFPDRSYADWSDPSVYTVVRHELVHLRDQRKYPVWFGLSYVLLLPTVLTFRAYWELRAFKATMLAQFEISGTIPERTITFILNQFTGPMYFWMWPFRENMNKKLQDIKLRILSGEIKGFEI